MAKIMFEQASKPQHFIEKITQVFINKDFEFLYNKSLLFDYQNVEFIPQISINNRVLTNNLKQNK